MKKEAVLLIAGIGVIAILGGIWFATTVKATSTTTTGGTTTTTNNASNGLLGFVKGLDLSFL